jgi:hypothetical protein
VEITCPPDCRYLKTSQAHPPASVRRQQERDMGFLMAMHEGLSPTQSELFSAILTFVVRFRGDPVMKVVDDDLSDGAAALAATYETAGRGVIYEHRPQSLVAQRFVIDLQGFLGTLAAETHVARGLVERDAAVVLRRLEGGARGARRTLDEGPATALDIISRVMTAAASHRNDTPGGLLVEPGRSMLVQP